jgi:uncharacterized cysteine cluster protein YcgN (CxxCxxCC family)
MSKNRKKKKDENLCRRCGKCCYIKMKFGRVSIFTNKHCEFLDTNTNLCTVYKDRFEKKPGCLTIEQAIALNALPNDCPYVKDIEGYEGPLG